MPSFPADQTDSRKSSKWRFFHARLIEMNGNCKIVSIISWDDAPMMNWAAIYGLNKKKNLVSFSVPWDSLLSLSQEADTAASRKRLFHCMQKSH